MPRITLVVLLIFLSNAAYATAFSFGNGESWLEICSGESEEMELKSAIQLCDTVLMAYQIGAITQAMELEQEPTLCSEKMFAEGVGKLFAEYIKADPIRMQQDFVELFPEFIKSFRDCPSNLASYDD